MLYLTTNIGTRKIQRVKALWLNSVIVFLVVCHISSQYCIVLHCGTVPAANAPGCIAAEGLLYKPWSLVVPTCTVNLRHGTNGFTSLPKGGVSP